MSIDPYRLLGVTPQATLDELKSAWHHRLRQYHPDRVQQAGPSVRAAAEDMTKLLNLAYEELSRRHQNGADKRTQGQKYTQIVSGRDLMQRGAAALDYAEGLMGRWQASVKTIVLAERRIDDALEAALSQRTSLVELHRAAASDDGVISREVDAMLAKRFDKPMKARMEALMTFDSHAQKRRHQLAHEILDSVPSRPEELALLLNDIHEKARQTANAYSPKLKYHQQNFEHLKAAQKRARDAYRRIRHEIKELVTSIEQARSALDQAILAIWTAHGLCRAEQANARGPEQQWVADRTMADAQTARRRADDLEHQQRVIETTDYRPVSERCAQKHAQFGDAFRDLHRCLVEVLEWGKTLEEQVSKSGLHHLTRLEQRLKPIMAYAHKVIDS